MSAPETVAVWFHSPQKAKKYSNPGDIETLPTPPGPGCAERANGCGTFGAAWNRVRSTQFVALLVQLKERSPGLEYFFAFCGEWNQTATVSGVLTYATPIL